MDRETRIHDESVRVSQLIIACLAGQIESIEALDFMGRLMPLNDSDLADMLGFDEVELQCRAFGALLGADCGAELKARLGFIVDAYAKRIAVALVDRDDEMREAA